MSKEQNLSPPPSPPVNNSNSLGNTVSSLPQLPDDFLSFQPQPSTHNSMDIDDNVQTNNSLNDRKWEQQQGSYRRGGNYYNKGREYYNHNDNRSYRGQKRGIYGTPSSSKGGQQKSWNNYSSPKKPKLNEKNINDIDISRYYKKSFLEDPWANLMKK
ncbi:17401_t:CDS:2 [Rhizophagus irregularis]|nr:17401_t:CDS:2 [Rhizophagus irregularis]